MKSGRLTNIRGFRFAAKGPTLLQPHQMMSELNEAGQQNGMSKIMDGALAQMFSACQVLIGLRFSWFNMAPNLAFKFVSSLEFTILAFYFFAVHKECNIFRSRWFERSHLMSSSYQHTE